MSDAPAAPTGPDLAAGIALTDLADGAMLAGHVGDDAVLLARRGEEIFAVGATCTHYGGPLVDGLMVGDTVRCPWHHACFSLRNGTAERAPALNPLPCFAVTRDGERVRVGAKQERDPLAEIGARRGLDPRGPVGQIVVIGAGAAGAAACEMLRREGFIHSVLVFDDDRDSPYDRPNLSKDYLAGNAPEEWIPLRTPEFWADHGIDIRHERVLSIDIAARRIRMAGTVSHPYVRLLIATGAEAKRLDTPGSDLPHVRVLRSLADSRAIIARATPSSQAVVIGASFIGLEVAASLRARDIEVHVVAPEARPLERVLGPEIGDFIRQLHESHGVHFHLGQTVRSIDAESVTLRNGDRIPASLVVAGVGVRPRLSLAESAGLTLDRGVLVNEHLETSAPGIWAAGDIARWPDPHSGERIRVEHWAVAERMGQTAARNMLGAREPFVRVPFFWSQHYDVAINYVGHAEQWDRIAIDGDINGRDCVVRYERDGRVLATATIGRDRESLHAELAMENRAN